MIIIGEFEEFGPGMGYPSIRDYIGKEPHPDKEGILRYLKKGHIHMVTASRIADIFSGEQTNNELIFMNDGRYAWSSRVIYYVEKYDLQLPEAFLEHMEGKSVSKRCVSAPRSLEQEMESIMSAFCALDPDGDWIESEWEEYLAKHASPILKEWEKYFSRHGDEGELCDKNGEFLLDQNGTVIQNWSISEDHRIVDMQGNQLIYSDGSPIMAEQMSDELLSLLKDEWGLTDDDRWY